MNQKQPHQGQKRILAVDDEPDLAITCSLALEHYGFKVGLRK
jgi:DNA-binding response OmpR family regulator